MTGATSAIRAAWRGIGDNEVTLTVLVPFAAMYMGEPLKLDYLWAALCMMGAVYFIFRS